MGILGDIIGGLADAINHASKIASNPEKAGSENARKDFGGSSAANLVEAIQQDSKIVSEYRDEQKTNSDIDIRYRESHKEELKRMLDDKIDGKS